MEPFDLKALILAELATDQAEQDVTSLLLFDVDKTPVQALIFSKETGVFSGSRILEAFQSLFSPQVKFSWKVSEGDLLQAQSPIVEMVGPKKTLLSLERTLLNFLGLACGVASHTRQFVEAVKPFPTQILATRKTLPGLRALQLSAVVAGGGKIHRRSLADGILIKENHLFHASESSLLERAHTSRSPLHGIEIEVQSFDSLEKVLSSTHPPDVIMIDNFSPAQVAQAVSMIRARNPRCRIEASGGVSLQTVRTLAEAGVDMISVGKLTHSSPTLNLSLDFKA